MKQLVFLLKILSLSLFFSFIYSCGSGDDGSSIPPSISGAVTSGDEATIPAGSIFTVKINGKKGSHPITRLSVLEGNSEITPDRINYNNSGINTNPIALTGSDQTEFTWSIDIIAQTGSSKKVYTFRIDDAGGEHHQVSIPITTTGDLHISFVEENPYFWQDTSLSSPTFFQVKINATQGASPMSNLTILEDGTAITASRAKFHNENDFNTAATFPANPLSLKAEEKESLNWVIWIMSHDMGTKNYAIQTEDEAGNVAEVSLNISL